VVFFPFSFFIAFLAVSLHEELKNTIKLFPENKLFPQKEEKPENLKNNRKKLGR
jgi:hypothetical protein